MDKKLLLEKYIKVAVRKALAEQEEQLKKQEKSVYIIYRVPGLKQAMIDLMSPSFSRFVSNVQVVAPKPTTFNIALVNGMDFYLTYSGKKFIAKIQGKKYNLHNLGETERASQSIANMLELNYTPVAEEASKGEKNTPDNALKSAELSQDLAAAGEEATPPETPAAGGETPPAEEETPPAEA